ncbi:TIGR00730 family Rossman fold protein [Candidatus Binatia bacterium]|nr:TIGR00730 family Rossman fold protein [Candidatus Binatia bacterium]
MPNVRAVTVYAGSSTRATDAHLRLAGELGDGIARRGWTVVYGGANVGLMGALADAALDAGGRVEGVILDTFARVAHAAIHDLVTVGDMRSRKAGLAHRGDAHVVLPGGYGTLEELSEILVERQLVLHRKPLVVVNHRGFWDPLLELVERMVAASLVKEKNRALMTVVPDAAAAIEAIARFAAEPEPVAPPAWDEDDELRG